jgi:hypothetical protein
MALVVGSHIMWDWIYDDRQGRDFRNHREVVETLLRPFKTNTLGFGNGGLELCISEEGIGFTTEYPVVSGYNVFFLDEIYWYYRIQREVMKFRYLQTTWILLDAIITTNLGICGK